MAELVVVGILAAVFVLGVCWGYVLAGHDRPSVGRRGK
jgi:hypothetical protein